jgi:SAM-dependent methyltransferase
MMPVLQQRWQCAAAAHARRCAAHARHCSAVHGQFRAASTTGLLQYGPTDDDDDDDDDEQDFGESPPDWAPPLGSLLLTHAVRGVFQQPPPPPPAHVMRRLRHLAKLRGVVELEREWKALQEARARIHGDLVQGQRYQKCKRAHREGRFRWATAGDLEGSPLFTTAVLPPYSAEAAEAYAWRRFGPSHAHHMRIMQEVAEALGESYAPRRVLDLGCGPGSGLAAAAQIWPGSVRELVGVDASAAMRVAADILLAPDEEAQLALETGKANAAAKLEAPSVRLEQSLNDVQSTAPTSTPGFDLAIISSTLSELGSDIERAEAVQSLWSSLEDGGVLIIQEHGGAIGTHFTSACPQNHSTSGFLSLSIVCCLVSRSLLCFLTHRTRCFKILVTGAFAVGAAREQLLHDSGVEAATDETGVQMITPSPHLNRQCPVAAEGVGQKTPRWVNFAQRVVNTAPARQAGGRAARKEVISESTSYFAAQKMVSSTGEHHSNLWDGSSPLDCVCLFELVPLPSHRFATVQELGK